MDIRQFLADPEEKPLDRMVTDGGFASIFRTVACVGDSLSSGEFESLDENGKLIVSKWSNNIEVDSKIIIFGDSNE